MKKTVNALKWKALLSLFCLILAAGVVASFFVYIPYVSNNGPIDGWHITLRMLITTVCIVHFFYGGVYYPVLYLSYLYRMTEKHQPYASFPKRDLSLFRGMLLVLLLIILLNINGANFWLALALLIVNYIFFRLTATNKLFVKKEIKFDETIVLPEIYDEDNQSSYAKRRRSIACQYQTINYLLPAEINDDDLWITKIFRSHILEQQANTEQEERDSKKKEFQTTEKSRELIKKIKG